MHLLLLLQQQACPQSACMHTHVLCRLTHRARCESLGPSCRAPQVKLGGKDKGQKALGRDAAAWQLAQLLGCLGVGVLSMLSSVGLGLRAHSRCIAAAFGVVYALQARPRASCCAGQLWVCASSRQLGVLPLRAAAPCRSGHQAFCRLLLSRCLVRRCEGNHVAVAGC